MKKISFKIISVILSLLMVISCMPLTALAGSPFGIRNKDLSESGTNDICTWSYDSETKTLYIDGKSIAPKDNHYLPAYSNLNAYTRTYCWMGFEHLVFGKNVTIISDIDMDIDYYPHLKTVEFEEGSKLKVIDDFVFEVSSVEEVTLPTGLVEIGDGAFEGTNIKEITIPASVTTIGGAAFACCEKLATINFEKRRTSLAIGGDAFAQTAITSFDFEEIMFDETFVPENMFAHCPNLESVNLTEYMTDIDNCAFQYCPNLKDIDLKNVEYIDDGAFQNSGLEHLYSHKVISIGREVFRSCHDLRTVYLPILDGMRTSCFFDCVRLNSVTMPKATFVDNYTFYGCSSLRNYNFSKVEKLGSYAFGSSGIESADLSKLTFIESSSFRNCKDLTSVKFADNLTEIGNYTFENCENLVVPELPSTVKALGIYAFANTAVSSVDIKGSIAYSNGVYSNCKKLKTATFDENTNCVRTGMFSGCNALTTVTFAKNGKMENIGDSAFYNCTSLKDIIIPDTVTAIGNDAFGNCVSLKEILLYPNVSNVGNFAFQGCKSLEKVIVTKYRTKLGQLAFDNTNAVIYGAKGSYAEKYANSNKLEFVDIIECEDISDDIKALVETAPDEDGAVAGTWTYGTWHFSADDSVLYIDGNGYVKEPRSSGIVSNGGGTYSSFSNMCSRRGIKNIDIVIGEGITQIGPYILGSGNDVTIDYLVLPDSLEIIDNSALKNLKITNVSFGKGLKKIGDNAFNASKVTSISFDKDCALESVGEQAFKGCTLTTFNFPSTVTSFGKDAFVSARFTDEVIDLSGFDPDTKFAKNMFNYAKVEKIIFGDIKNISEGMFRNCTKLTEVVIPDTVESIAPYAFYYCSNAEDITLPSNITSLPEYCFSYSGVVNINLDNIVSIGDYCFNRCNRLKSVTAPNVKTIGRYAFQTCQALASVSFPMVTSLPTHVFDTCPYLTDIDIPNLAIIGDYAFANCTALKDFDLSNPTIINIGNYAFRNTRFESVTIYPDKTYGQYCFTSCAHLKSVTIDRDAELVPWGAFSNCGSLSSINFESGCKVNTISANAFRNCDGITRIVIPPSVKLVSSWAFDDCSNLTQVVLSKNVAELGQSAFDNCSKLEYLVIPKFAVAIGKSAISSGTTVIGCTNSSASEFCKSLSSVKFVASTDDNYITAYPELGFITEYNQKGDYNIEQRSDLVYGTWEHGEWGFSADQSILYISGTGELTNTFKTANGVSLSFSRILSFKNKSTDLTIHIGDGITSICDDFANCAGGSILTLYIKEGVKSIGENAFKNVKIYKLNLKDDVTTIGAHAFEGCQIDSVYYNNTLKLESVGDYAFCNNALRSYIYTDNLRNIGAHAYESNDISEFSPKGNNLVVGDYAFNKNALKTINIVPGNTIGDYAFANSSYYNITYSIFDGVTAIPNGIFANCVGIKELVLPDSVKSIGYESFMGTSITSLVFDSNITEIKARAFYNCDSLKTVGIDKNVKTVGSAAFGDCYLLNSITFENDDVSIYTDTIDKSKCAVGFNSYGYINKDLKIYGNISSTAYRYANSLGLNFVPNHSVCDASGYICENINSCYDNTACTWEYFASADALYLFGNSTMAGDWRDENGNVITAPRAGKIIIASGITGLGTSLAGVGAKEISIPSSVTDIYDAFNYCDKLEYISIPNSVQTMNNETFKGCKSLKSLSLGTGLNNIPISCAADCTNLKYLYLYGSTVIGEYAFRNCSSLQTVTIPDSVTTIRTGAFENCYSVFNVRLGESVRTISSKSFANLPLLDTITFSGSISNISDDAFIGCSTSSGGVDIVLENNVVTINVDGLSNIDVKYITIGERFKNFDNAPNIPTLKEYKLSDTNTNGYTVYKGCLYKDNVITNVPQSLDSVEIKQGTTSIGDYAFAYSSVNTIRIPESVRSIGSHAFYKAQSLKTVRFPSTVRTIGDSAFEECVKLKSVSIPYPCISLGDRAFNKCKLLASIILPESMETIGANCFSECDALESIVFPQSVTSIGNGALAFNSNLKSVYVWYAEFDNYLYYGSSIPTTYTMAGSCAHGFARTKNYPFTAYTDEEIFADICFEMMDILSGFLGYCTEGHGDIEWLNVYEGDCENDGYQIGVCEYCSEILDEKHTYAEGHDYTQLVYMEETETDYGIRVLRCNNCDTRYTEYYEPLGVNNPTVGVYNVSGKIAADTGIENSRENTAIENAELVINGNVVAKTDEDGHFRFKMKTGVYMLEVRYLYGFTRYLALSITDHDVIVSDNDPIKIVACDFNRDGIIDAADQTLFTLVTASKEGDVSYLKAVDINNDGYINARDYVIIGRFKGQTATTYQYPERNIY